jgi:hypothetical protein
LLFDIKRRPDRPLKPSLCLAKLANRQQTGAHAPLGDHNAQHVADPMGDPRGALDFRRSPGVFTAINIHAREDQQNPHLCT